MEQYEVIEIEIIEFDDEDVITASMEKDETPRMQIIGSSSKYFFDDDEDEG